MIRLLTVCRKYGNSYVRSCSSRKRNYSNYFICYSYVELVIETGCKSQVRIVSIDILYIICLMFPPYVIFVLLSKISKKNFLG